MSPEVYAAAATILLAAYFIRGISGFGSGLIAVPLLALWLPLQFVVPLMLLLDFSASLLLGGVNFRQVDWREIRVLLPFSLIGVITGTALLLHLPLKPTLIVLALFVGAFGVRSLLNLHGDRLISRWWAMPAAFTGGAVGALFGTGGPPYVIYLTHRIHDKGRLRASFSGLFFIEGLLRITSFAVVGLFADSRLLWAYLLSLPIMAGGLMLGSRVHVGLSRVQLMQLIGVLLVLSSISLLIKADI
ncbi:MAG: sulfite exporter TauE/SafE family protein [Pseudomonadota bacterium]